MVILKCTVLDNAVLYCFFFSAERLKDVNQDSVPYRVLDEVIPQLRRTGRNLGHYRSPGFDCVVPFPGLLYLWMFSTLSNSRQFFNCNTCCMYKLQTTRHTLSPLS